MRTLATAAILALGVAGLTHAEDADGKFLIRARMIKVQPANDGGYVDSAVGGKTNIKSDTVPEIDASYFFTPNIAAELIAATTTHKVNLDNRPSNLALGKVRLLPPTLTAQYHFTQFGNIKPYVGAGVTYAHFYDAEHAGAIHSVKYDDAWGAAVQAGVDYKLTKQVYLNADIKKVMLKTDVTVNDTVKAKANIDPTIMGVGVGYRF